MSVTAVIPTIPPRADLLCKAVASAAPQVDAISIAVDSEHQGAPATRTRALRAAQTEWVAFLDDDDEWLSWHVERLLATARESGADYVFSYFTIRAYGGNLRDDLDPLGNFGRVFDPVTPHQTTITTLVRTELAQSVGFREPPEGLFIEGQRHGEDFQFTLDCVAAGAKIVHLPERTWIWNHHGANTSGRPDRW